MKDLNLPTTLLKMSLAYHELDEKRQEIRVLDLHPGVKDEQIQLTLRHVSLIAPVHEQRKRASRHALQQTLPAGWVAEETSQYHFRFIFEDPNEDTTWTHPDPNCEPSLWQELDEMPPLAFEPKYEALSYTWGDEEASEPVIVKFANPVHDLEEAATRCTTTLIRPNLAAALRALRGTDRPRTLWIDAVCIDQSNNKERALQVSRMSRVYALAQRVVVWLGPCTSSTAKATATLDHLGSQVEVSRNRTRYRSPNATEPELFRSETPLLYDNETWSAIYEFLSHAWFERLWIWQEIQLANSKAVVICGAHEIEWQCLRKAIICLFSKDELPHHQLRQRLGIVERLTLDPSGSSLLSLLTTSQHRLCSEAKDHVYGILSLCGPMLASKIKPDYDPKVGYMDVYKDVFLKYENMVHRLDLLSLCEAIPGKRAYPSWVPDLSQTRATYPLNAFSLASGISCSSARYIEPDVLQVEGSQAGTIVDILQVMPADLEGTINALGYHQPKDMSAKMYPTGENMFDAYCATMRAGYLHEKWPTNTDLSLEKWKAQYLQTVGALQAHRKLGVDQLNNVDLMWCLKLICGRAIFQTQDGHIGLGPSIAQPGDVICVLLGCQVPMLLRPCIGQARIGWEVMGECYVYGMEDGSALLGPLSTEWRSEYGKIPSGYTASHTYVNTRTQEAQEDDPRLGPLPEDWKSFERARNPDDPSIFRIFSNVLTGEEINSDPRLSSELLRRRGATIEVFELV